MNNIVLGLGGKNRQLWTPKTSDLPVSSQAHRQESPAVPASPIVTPPAADSVHFEGRGKKKRKGFQAPIQIKPEELIQVSDKKPLVPSTKVPSGTKLETVLVTPLLTLTNNRKEITGAEMLAMLRDLSNKRTQVACHTEDFANHLGTTSQSDKYRIYEALRSLEKSGLIELKERDDPSTYDLWKEWSITGFGRKMLAHHKTLTPEQFQVIEKAFDPATSNASLQTVKGLAQAGQVSTASGNSLHAFLSSPAAQVEDKSYTGIELLQNIQKYIQTGNLYTFSSWDTVSQLNANNEYEKGSVYSALRMLHAHGLIDKVGNAKSLPGQEWRLTKGARMILSHWTSLSAQEVDSLGSILEGSKEAMQRAKQRSNVRLEKIESTIKSLLSPGKEGQSPLELLKRFPDAEKGRSGWSKFFHKGLKEKEIFKTLNFRDPAALREQLEILEKLGLIFKNDSDRYQATDRGQLIIDKHSVDPLKVLGIHHEDIRQVIRMEVGRLSAQKEEKNKQFHQLIAKNAEAQEVMKQKEDTYEILRQAAIESYDRSQTISDPGEKHRVEAETSEKILKADMLRQEAHEAKQWARQLKRELDAAKLIYNESIRLLNQSVLKLNRTIMALDRSQSNESVAALKNSLQSSDHPDAKGAAPTITSMLNELLYRKTGSDDALDVDDANLEADHVASTLVEKETMAQRIAEMRREVATETNPLDEAAKANQPVDTTPKNTLQIGKDGVKP